MSYDFLQYRGNFECSVGIDYSGAHLGAEYGAGYYESEKVFPGLLFGRLNYSALSRRVRVRLATGEAVSRLNYVWFFYRACMDNGRKPFLMRSPLDERLYLWKFADESLEITLVDLFLGTCGLGVRQVRVKGVAMNADGSIDEGVLRPDVL